MRAVGSDKSNCCLDVNSHCAWTGDVCVEIENLGGNTDQCGVDDSSGGDGGGGGNLPPCAAVGSDKSNCCLDVNSHCAWTGDVCVEIENLGANTDQCGVDDSACPTSHISFKQQCIASGTGPGQDCTEFPPTSGWNEFNNFGGGFVATLVESTAFNAVPSGYWRQYPSGTPVEDFLQDCALTCLKSHEQSPDTHAPYFGTHIGSLRCSCRKASDSQDLKSDTDNNWGAFKISCVDDSGGSSNLPPCAGVGTDKSNCCMDVNSHCAWTGDVCVEIENLGANTDQCGVDDSACPTSHISFKQQCIASGTGPGQDCTEYPPLSGWNEFNNFGGGFINTLVPSTKYVTTESSGYWQNYPSGTPVEDFLQECALTCYKSHVQSPSTHAPYFGTHIDTLRCACRKASDSQELRADSDNVWGAFKTSCTAPSSGATTSCAENEHVSNGACTACPAGKVRPAEMIPVGEIPNVTVFQLRTLSSALLVAQVLVRTAQSTRH